MCLTMAVGQPVLASPEVDAKLIAAAMVRTEKFHQGMRAGLAEIAAGQLSHILSERSVKIRDQDRLIALMPDLYTGELADGIERKLDESLLQDFSPDELATLAAYHLRVSLDPLADGQLKPTTAALQGTDPTLDRAKTMAGFTLLGIVTGVRLTLKLDLKAPYIADILVVNGVFEFPNRIVRQNIIREFRTAAP
jgi:hypothetical protein